MEEISRRRWRLSQWVPSLLLVSAVVPLAVAHSTRTPTWDELFFLHRAACVNNAVFDLSGEQLAICMANMFKSPVMSVLLLPAGPLDGDVGQLAVAPFMLGLITFGLAIWLAFLVHRLQVALPAIVGLAGAIALSRPAAGSGGGWLLVDGAYALLVAIALLLPFIERELPVSATRTAVARGLLWGGITAAGVLSKLTFPFFLAMIAPLTLVLSWRHSGIRSTLIKSAVASGVCLLPLVMFVEYGSIYFRIAWLSSYGSWAPFYDDQMSLRQFFGQLGVVNGIDYRYWLLCATIVGFGLFRRRRDPVHLLLALAAGTLVLVYLAMVVVSTNREPRFLWPVWIALPLIAACLTASGHGTADRFLPTPAIVVAFLLALPMLWRFDFHVVTEATALMRMLPRDRPVTLQIASDESALNIETLVLAKELNRRELARIYPTTVVYDLANGRTLEHSLNALRNADFVLLRSPVAVPPGPEFSNRFAADFLKTVRSCGHYLLDEPGPPELIVAAMQPSRC